MVFLSGLINDLSTLSRAERGALKMEMTEINTIEFLENLQRLYSAEAEQKGLELRLKFDKNLPNVKTSELYLREVLQNFITNAIKYTDQGYVAITAESVDDGVMFIVSDTGIGISKTDLEHVFDKFFRSENFKTREHSGTGLGLYVAMKLVKLMGAKIDASSELGVGSKFSVFVPKN